jgi:hypothetical protein
MSLKRRRRSLPCCLTAGSALACVLPFTAVFALIFTVEWFWSGPSLSRYGATSTFGSRLDGDRVFIGFGGWGFKEEDMPRSPEEIKDFHRALSVAPGGKPAPEWYCELVDALSADGGWENSKYEFHNIS